MVIFRQFQLIFEDEDAGKNDCQTTRESYLQHAEMTLFSLIQVGLLKMEVYLDNFIIWTQPLFAVMRDYILVFSVTYQKQPRVYWL